MPSGPLPPEDYLGDPNRITSEFQEQLNNLQNYVRQLKAELDALSSQTIREGAVRGIGTGSGDLVDNNRLADYVAGEVGELGTAATRDVTISTGGPSGGNDGDLWFEY